MKRQENLLKSLKQARSLNRAQRSEMLDKTEDAMANRKHICARRRGNLELIPIEDVYYFQADQKYVTVRHKEGEVIIEESLKSLENDLSERFIRIHRNALVARNQIKNLSKSAINRVIVTVADNELEVSRRRVPNVRRFFREQ